MNKQPEDFEDDTNLIDEHPTTTNNVNKISNYIAAPNMIPGSKLIETNPPKITSKDDFTPLNWNNFFDKLEYQENGTSIFTAEGPKDLVYLCIPGFGSSAQAFACLAKELKQTGTIVAFDLRGHGHSKREPVKPDLRTETLVNDAIKILVETVKRYQNSNIVIVGHSLGAAIAVKAVDIAGQDGGLVDRIKGVVDIDSVEGTVIAMKPIIEKIVQERQKRFKNEGEAIQWAYTSLLIRDLTSARVSVPSQLIPFEDKATNEKGVTWKVDLVGNMVYFIDWFTGLTKAFLNIKFPRLLILAGDQKIDEPLVKAFEKGEFSLKNVYDVGHYIQEDNPKETAQIIQGFVQGLNIHHINK